MAMSYLSGYSENGNKSLVQIGWHNSLRTNQINKQTTGMVTGHELLTHCTNILLIHTPDSIVNTSNEPEKDSLQIQCYFNINYLSK